MIAYAEFGVLVTVVLILAPPEIAAPSHHRFGKRLVTDREQNLNASTRLVGSSSAF